MKLEEIRTEIDNLDHELVELFKMRMNMVKEVANYKIAHNLPIFNPKREQEILDALTPEGELGPYTREFLEHLFTVSKDYQKEIIAREGSL